jgi:hypothetical protein
MLPFFPPAIDILLCLQATVDIVFGPIRRCSFFLFGASNYLSWTVSRPSDLDFSNDLGTIRARGEVSKTFILPRFRIIAVLTFTWKLFCFVVQMHVPAILLIQRPPRFDLV